MTRHVTDDEMYPRGHLVRRGSALHRKYRNHPIGHDLDVLLAQAGRGEPYDLARKIHQHGRTLRDPAQHGGHSKAPVRRHRR
jgi:hypothetical protein